MKAYKHLKTVLKHKWYVMIACFKCGLYKQGIMHDMSKLGFTEFWSGVKYYQGDSSPIDAEKKEKGYSLAWQHHKGHNPHHWEYWIDNVGTYKNTPCKVPYKYVVEMICDWIGAGKVYVGKEWKHTDLMPYYKKVRGVRIIHPETEQLILTFLTAIHYGSLNNFYKMAKDKRIKEMYEGESK